MCAKFDFPAVSSCAQQANAALTAELDAASAELGKYQIALKRAERDVEALRVSAAAAVEDGKQAAMVACGLELQVCALECSASPTRALARFHGLQFFGLSFPLVRFNSAILCATEGLHALAHQSLTGWCMCGVFRTDGRSFERKLRHCALTGPQPVLP
jgi:hypothetical protein